MSVERLTRESFDAAVARNACLVVEFAAAGADPAPLEALAAAHADVAFARVDAHAEPALREMFGVAGTDALVILRERIVLYCEAGAHPAERVAGLLERVQNLDMAAVRAAIDSEKAELALRMRRVCPTAQRGPLI